MRSTRPRTRLRPTAAAPLIAALAAVLATTPAAGTAPVAAPPVLSVRGYYVTFMRMPTYDLAQWKTAIDGMQADGANTLLLWTAGAFRSRKFPVTWKWNAQHENVRRDFVRDLIDYAHEQGVRVVLGFTPFAYDGVNQYPLEHPGLRATGKDGAPAGLGGIACWGYNLCPSKPEAQHFMLEYVREMYFDFYPNADGLLIESSDYAICHCPDCGARYFEKEFEFVRRISQEAWAHRPTATVIVYPHYFSDRPVPGFGVKGSALPFDPRWTLFFTPHSAHLDGPLISKARTSLYWDDAPSLGTPQGVGDGARRARDAKVSGYVPSLEAFSFIATHPEEGQQYLVGKRQVPFGFGWLPEGRMPYDESLARVNRIAYRHFTGDPDLPFGDFKKALGAELLGEGATPQAVDDLLELHRAFFVERTWCQPSPLASPERVRAMRRAGRLEPAKAAEYRAALERVRAIESRHRDAASAGLAELHRVAAWLLRQWEGEEDALVPDAPR